MKLKAEHIAGFFKTREEYFDFIGNLYGYSLESREFFSKNLVHKTIDEVYKGQTKKDYDNSGLNGSGYISNPRELRDLRLGKITLEEIARGISIRRAIKIPFEDSLSYVRKTDEEKEVNSTSEGSSY